MEDMLPITKARANQLPRTPKQSRAIISKDKIISAAKVILSSEFQVSALVQFTIILVVKKIC
jgi:hypothetical protein